MRLLFVWPGKTRNASYRAVQQEYLEKIKLLAQVRLVETQVARGLEEKWAEKILEKEAQGLEKYAKDNGIILEGVAWEYYLSDPAEATDPGQLLTLIAMPLKTK